MTRIVISGICGRMGKRIALLASRNNGFEVVGALEAPGNSAIGKDVGEVLGIGDTGKKVEDDFSRITSSCDALIEFTSPEATMEHLKTAVAKKVAMVIGTTALSSRQTEKVKEASAKIPILFSPNMSVGVNILFKMVGETSEILDKDYKVKITETHHTEKKDAPSGTAKKLGEIVSRVRGKTPSIESKREGDVIGDHTVIFTGELETIELTHKAHSRDVFAKGALDAARFVSGKKPGLYTMHDVIKQG